MKKILLTAFIFAMAGSLANAQYYYDRSKLPAKKNLPGNQINETKTGPDYDKFFYFLGDVNQPVSNKDFISNGSNFATKLGFRKRLNSIDRFWAGAELGYAVYKQHFPYQSYQYGSPTTTISAELFNYAVNYSLTGNLDYFFLPMEKIITPYAGFAVGISYDRFSQYYNIISTDIKTYGVQIRPEIGVLIGFRQNSSWRIKAAAHYDYASNAGDLVKNNFITPGDNNYKNFINYGFQVGIVKMAW